MNFELATVPRDVRDAGWRVVAWGVAALIVVAVGGLMGERLRYGGDLSAARDRIAADAQQQFSSLAARLDAAVEDVRADPLLPAAVASRDAAAIRELFDRVAALDARLGLQGDALTVYTPQGRTVAWAGRPGQLPADRLSGPDALFLAPSSTGLRLTRVAAVTDPAAPERRVATVVAEVPLPRTGEPGSANAFAITTSVIPVPVRLTFETRTAAGADDIIIRDPQGRPIARADAPPDEISAGPGAVARGRTRHRAADRLRGRAVDDRAAARLATGFCRRSRVMSASRSRFWDSSSRRASSRGTACAGRTWPARSWSGGRSPAPGSCCWRLRLIFCLRR